MIDQINAHLHQAMADVGRGDRVDAIDQIKLAVRLISDSYTEQDKRDYSTLEIPYIPGGGMTELVTVVATGYGCAYIKTWQGDVYFVGRGGNYLDHGSQRGISSRKALARILGVPLNRITKWRKDKRDAEAKQIAEEDIERIRREANFYGYVLKPFNESAKKPACPECGASEGDPVHSTTCSQHV